MAIMAFSPFVVAHSRALAQVSNAWGRMGVEKAKSCAGLRPAAFDQLARVGLILRPFAG